MELNEAIKTLKENGFELIKEGYNDTFVMKAKDYPGIRQMKKCKEFTSQEIAEICEEAVAQLKAKGYKFQATIKPGNSYCQCDLQVGKYQTIVKDYDPWCKNVSANRIWAKGVGSFDGFNEWKKIQDEDGKMLAKICKMMDKLVWQLSGNSWETPDEYNARQAKYKTGMKASKNDPRFPMYK